MELRKDPENEKLRHLCIVKGNYLNNEYKNESFELTFSENMTFEFTGNRISFEELVKKTGKEEEMDERMSSVKHLKEEGLTLREIEKKTGISKSQVDRILKK